MATAKKFVLAAHFQGAPKRSDLKIVEEKLPALNDGGESLSIICNVQLQVKCYTLCYTLCHLGH